MNNQLGLPELPSSIRDYKPAKPTPSTTPAGQSESGEDYVKPVGNVDKYVEAVFRSAVHEVENAKQGNRNNTLYDQALKLAGFVKNGYLTEADITGRLTEAAIVSGTDIEGVPATINSGLTKGMSNPAWKLVEEETTLKPSEEVEDPNQPLDWNVAFGTDYTKIDYELECIGVERGQLVALVGGAKAGKSLLMLDWIVRNILPNKRKVLYLDFENTERDIIKRLMDMRFGPKDLDGFIYLSFPILPPINTPKGGEEIQELVEKHKPDVLIIDTLSRVIDGKENDSDVFLAAYRHTFLPLKKAKITVFRLDHTGHQGDNARGSSAKSSDVDHSWTLTTGVADDHLKLKRTHTRTGIGEDEISLVRLTEPLRHVLGASVEVDDEVSRKVKLMDDLGLPNNAGRDKAIQAITGAGKKPGAKATLQEALRIRKARSAPPVAMTLDVSEAGK
jgi:hypothetical protein